MRTVHTGNTVVRGSCYAALPFWYASNTKALLLLANEGKLSLKHTNNVPGNPLSIAEQLLFLKEGIKKIQKDRQRGCSETRQTFQLFIKALTAPISRLVKVKY